ncbi:unnamed protein product [Malus baccata var. baccata]
MAAPNYTALAPPPQLQPPLAVANFKNERAISRATAKTRINMRPPNSIHMRGLSTTNDQIPNNDSPVAPSAGNLCHDLFYKVVKPYKYQYRTKKNPEAEAEVDASCAYLKQPLPLAWSHCWSLNEISTQISLLTYYNADSSGKRTTRRCIGSTTTTPRPYCATQRLPSRQGSCMDFRRFRTAF